MAQRMTCAGSGKRLALFAAALLLALGAMLALAAAASAQDPDNGQSTGGSSSGSSGTPSVAPADDDDQSGGDDQSGDDEQSGGGGDDQSDDDQSGDGTGSDSQDACSNMDLDVLLNRYFARYWSNGRALVNNSVARIPQSERLTAEQRQCALTLQDAKYPNLRWGFQTRCPRHQIYSFRPTGGSQTIDGVEFRQWEKIEDYECTSRWLPTMVDGSKVPPELIPPGEPVSIITVKYRVRVWIQWTGFDRDSVPAAPASESTLADDDA